MKAHTPHCPVPRAQARGENAPCLCGGVPEAVRLINTTVHQWRQALKEGIDTNEHRSVLVTDLDNVAAAMEVITDWAP